MAERELTEEAEKKAKQAKMLFDVLCKKDVSDEQIKAAGEQIKTDPALLENYAFVDGFGLSSFVTDYKPGSDINAMLEANSEAQAKLKIVLDNLKKIELPKDATSKTSEVKLSMYTKGEAVVAVPPAQTAANYFLNNALLANGEIIGTQMVKNIHFLGTLNKDKEVKLFEDETQNQAARMNANKKMDESIDFYKSLYHDYGADKNAKNDIGQGVNDLMLTCTKRISKDDSIEALKERTFMKSPIERQPERATTLAEARMRIYRGNATVEDKKMIEDSKKEDTLQNMDDPNNKYGGGDSSNWRFKDEDIIKYMYEEWFLALMSWGFNKIDEGVQIALGYMTDKFCGHCAKIKDDAKKVYNEDLKPTIDKVASFSEQTSQMLKNFKQSAHLYEDLFSTLKGVDLASLNPEDERALKEKYPECSGLIDTLKNDPKKREQFTKKSPEEIKILSENIKAAGELALMLSSMEMIDEVMRSDKRWRDEMGVRYASDDVLLLGDKGFVERAKKRQEKIIAALNTLSEDARGLFKEEYMSLKTPEEKTAWIKKNITGEYEKQIQDKNTSPERRQELSEGCLKFEQGYKDSDGHICMTDKDLCGVYASLKVSYYIDKMERSCSAAFDKQKEFHEKKKYDVVGHAPTKDVKSIIENADDLTDQVIDKGVGHSAFFGKKQKETSSKRTLEEEAKSYLSAIPLERMLEDTDKALSTAAGRASIMERKKRVEEVKKKNPLSASQLYGGTSLGVMGYKPQGR